MKSSVKNEVNSFLNPSDLFRWSLDNDSRNDEYQYKKLFQHYYTLRKENHYIWSTYNRRLKSVIDIVKHKKNLRVLEVGCGFGHDLAWIAQFGHKVVGVDVKSIFIEISADTKNQIQKIKKNKLNITLQNINILDLDEKNKFDLIYMKDTYHHLEPRNNINTKLSRLLNKNGTLVIIEPNAWNFLIQLQMFKIRGFNTIIKKNDPKTGPFIYGNERLVTGLSLKKNLNKNNVFGTSQNIRLIPTILSKYTFLTKIANFLEGSFFEKLLFLFCVHTIFVGQKK